MLTPLYLIGLAALSIPLVLHFIRRSPKGRVPFSTLMFLQSSPPTMTRRSKLDHLLLLLIRALAIILIVLAFCRPYFLTNAQQKQASIDGRRIAILVDRSASMRRGNMWQQALEKATEIIDQLEDGDQACLILFDRTAQTAVGFEQEASFDLSIRRATLKDAMAEQSPGWSETNLGDALIVACDLLEEQNTLADAHDQNRLQIELISDLQSGIQLAALQSHQWPDNLKLRIHSIQPSEAGNATLSMLVDETETAQSIRVRVTNNSDSIEDQFRVDWVIPDTTVEESPVKEIFVNLQVPPGESRVVQLKRPGGNILPTGIRLSGDHEQFDNLFHLPPPTSSGIRIEYLSSSDDRTKQGLWFYLQKAFGEELDNQVSLVTDEELLRGLRPNLVVIADVADQSMENISAYLKRGGRVLVVVRNQQMQETIRQLCNEPTLEISEAKVDRFALVGQVNFRHPLFAPFADPKFNDFTSSHFWKYRKLSWEDSGKVSGSYETSALNGLSPDAVIASFDNGDPAIIHQSMGLGELYILTSGWNPADSQLAVDTKFVPLLLNLLGRRSTVLRSLRQKVGDLIALNWNETGKISRIDPKGDSMILDLENRQVQFLADMPGVYRVESANESQLVAVNLAAEESLTAPMEVDELKQLGVGIGEQVTKPEAEELERQLQRIELEGTQRIWSKLLIVALILLFAETILAGWFARKQNEVIGEPG